ncbi:nuclear transport factor 2 family protein [Streptomyces sp. AP-93]|uniref:nuclear transport factor 2 family protein n=1 Tax=Streptomyces sp. AP-93 TaxID=2929048 RepID=UPI001FAE851F|nr:nuclear transport factor 2 family protein [Streptomyces sp. AP-93]MCJ0872590.1 nuclear transport factor 2 family protein [Streptomyces sp. AP-93]
MAENHRADPTDPADEAPQDGIDNAVHAELTAVAEAWAAAIVSNDAARIASFMTDDWAIVSESGIASKDDFLAFVASGQLTHSAMDLVSTPRVRVHGDTAVFTVRMTNTAHYGDQRFHADEWTSDVFVKRGDRWLCLLSHITAAAPESAATSSTTAQ